MSRWPWTWTCVVYDIPSYEIALHFYKRGAAQRGLKGRRIWPLTLVRLFRSAGRAEP